MTSLDDFAVASSPAADTTPKGWEAGVEVGTDGGTIVSGPVTEPIKDWNDLLRVWNLSPEVFEVVEPVTFKAWDGFAKETNGDGTQTVVSKRLYSYKARIQQISPHAIPDEILESWHAKLLQVVPQVIRPTLSRGETYSFFVADPQLGKKGTSDAVDNWKSGVRRHLDRATRLVNQGHKITQIHIGFMGDEHEQVCNNYANQPYTVELNLSEQIELDFALRVWTIEQACALGIPILVTSVISNHGEWTRNDSKDPVTSKADNSSTSVMRLVSQLVQKVPTLSSWVSFNIADSNPDIVVDLSGVKTVLSHGHIAKGKGSTSEQKVKTAIERQILGRTSEIGDAQVYVTAHYHHFHCQEFEGRTLFGCPALEAEKSSEYMLDQYGVWSPPGMLGLLISDRYPRGWSEVAVL